jgi:probable HAF family extracellular repeat protein
MKRWLISSLAVTALALSSLPLSAQRPLLTSATIDGSSIAAVSVNPGGGASYTQVFALQYTHSQGAGDIVSARVRFGSSNVGPGTCTARYNATSGSLGLLTDAGTGWTEAAIGSGSLANSQCTLNLAASSVTLGGTNLKMVLAITFSPSFAGLKQIYLLATDAGGANTGWQTRGTWTVPPAGPAPISVSPTAGAGLTWPFTLHYSDSLGAADLSSARVRFGASNVGPGTCTARFDAVAGSVELLDDSGTSWLPGTIGSGTLANSQCTLNLTESDATVNGNDVTVVLNVTFAPTFTGLKKIYMLAASSSGGSSGWVRKGTWRPNPGPGVTSMIDLGTLGGAESFAYAVNDNGQIAGNSSLADNTTHGFFWTPTTGIVDIGTVGGASSTFSALNANGQIVGSSASDSNVDHPFSWTPSGGMVNIGSPGHAFGVNDDGLVVGDIGDEHAPSRGRRRGEWWSLARLAEMRVRPSA